MGKISPEEKIEWVEKIIQNKESVYSVASKIGVHPSSIDTWVRNYKSIGTEAFFRKGWTKRSSAEKKSAVEDYLAGKGSLRDVCAKYKITDTYQLRTWIKQYNGHEVLKDSGTGGSPIMTKGRKTAFEERVEIVQYCIKYNHNYTETAEEMDELEKLRAEVKILHAEKKRAEMEISFLKKLEEIERRRS